MRPLVRLFWRVATCGLLMGIHPVQSAHSTTVHFGTDATYPPLVYLDNNRHVTGFETELLKTICHQLQWSCTFTHEEWDNLIPALNSGKIDAMYGGIGITEARQAQFLFTQPLIDESLAGLIAEDTHVLLPFTEAGLKHKKIGVQTGSTFAHYLSTQFPMVQVKRYVSIQDALLDLTTKRIDAVFGDTPVLRNFTRSLPPEKQSLYTVTGIDLNPENLNILGLGYGVAFNKTPEAKPMVTAINTQLKRFQGDPAYHALKLKFGINP